MKDLASFVAVNRFGLGPAPGEADAVGQDPRQWVKAQIRRQTGTPEALAPFRSAADIFAGIHRARLDGAEALGQANRAAYRDDFSAEVLACARWQCVTKTPFEERMVRFWSNHFTVSRSKGMAGPTIPAFEREAIRPHVFGSFAAMLRAVSQHPTMLTYLDNASSVGEQSPAGRQRRRRTGAARTLNENLAREILELHTLGVAGGGAAYGGWGGYTQHDVVELAKAISGWSHGGLRPKREAASLHGGFEFRADFHEPGSKTVLGRTYTEDGVNEGTRVLDDLARHPSTATFLASKLVRHLVADDPPAAAVRKIAGVFRDSDGDLARVSAALVDLDEAWSQPASKVKSHQELVISVLRSTGRAVRTPEPGARDLVHPLGEMGQAVFAAPSPAGWGDTASHWLAPEALMRRIEWIRRYASTLPATLHPDRLLEDTIGPVASDATRTWVRRAPSGDAAIAMVLASAEFQRR